LSIKDVPEALAQKLRQRAARHHRSLQGELMAIVEAAAGEENTVAAGGRQASEPVAAASYGARESASGDLLDEMGALAAAGRLSSAGREARLARLREIAASTDTAFQAASRLTREEANDRALLRRLGI